MRIESLLVYLPAVSRRLPLLAIVMFTVLLIALALLALAGGTAHGPLATLVPDGSVQPFRWG
jgi:hypothetical protein